MDTRIDHQKPRSRVGVGCWWSDLYPVDETLMLLADHIEALATTGKSGREVQPLDQIVTASEMKASLVYNNFANNWAVSVPNPIQSDDIDLPLDPYVLGAWLGDGHSRVPAITSADVDLIDHIEAAGYPITRIENRTDNGAASTYHFGQQLRLDLRACGYSVSRERHAKGKFIPSTYLRASESQRLALLQGLMDTDGTIAKVGWCELCLCDETLIYDALELIRSLGIKASISSSDATIAEDDPDSPGNKRRRITGTRWRIHFTTETIVFRLPRKAVRLKTEIRVTQRWNYVTDITVGDVVPMRCISVEHPEHLYLTDGFIPTHNSVSGQALLYGAAIKGLEIFVVDPMKGAADFKFLEPYARAMALTINDAAATLKAIYEDVVRRKNLNSKYGAATIYDLPIDVRPAPMFIFMDEFTSLIFTSRPPSKPFEDPDLEAGRLEQVREFDDRSAIQMFTGKIAREARSAGVSLGLGTQKLIASTLDQAPDLKANLSRLLVGPTSQGDRMSALRAFDQAPDLGDIIPKGRGIWESSAKSAGVLVQGWFATAHLFGEELAKRIEPLSPDQRLDITPFLSRGVPSTGFVVGPIAAPDDEVIDLGEMAFSLDDLMVSDEGADVDVDVLADIVVETGPVQQQAPWQIDWSTPAVTESDDETQDDVVSDEDDDPFAPPVNKTKPAPRLADDDDPFA